MVPKKPGIQTKMMRKFSCSSGKSSSSADYHSSPGEVTPTFIPEESGPSEVLPVLGDCNFPLTNLRTREPLEVPPEDPCI